MPRVTLGYWPHRHQAVPSTTALLHDIIHRIAAASNHGIVFFQGTHPGQQRACDVILSAVVGAQGHSLLVHVSAQSHLVAPVVVPLRLSLLVRQLHLLYLLHFWRAIQFVSWRMKCVVICATRHIGVFGECGVSRGSNASPSCGLIDYTGWGIG